MASPGASSNNDFLTGWFFSLFAHCEKAPATEDDLRFDGADGKKKKNEKATPASSSQGAPGVLRRYTVVIGSSRGKMKTSGLAYRNSKSTDDKVKGGAKRAKWGDVVEGVDQGDGWLKVGEHFLPMQRKGVSVLALVADDAAKDVQVVAPSQPSQPFQPSQPSQPWQQQSWFARPSVGTWNQQTIKFSPAPTLGAEDAVAPSFGTVQKAPRLAQTASEGDGCPAAATQLAETQFETAAAAAPWNQRPSVGTWLQRRQEVRAAKAPADGAGLQLEVAEERAQVVEVVRESSDDEVEFRLLPSVGTWIHLKIRPRIAVAEAEQRVEKVAEGKEAADETKKLDAAAKLNSVENLVGYEAAPVALAVER